MNKSNSGLTRRNFVKSSVITGLGAVIATGYSSAISLSGFAKPATNIADALKYARNTSSMPGLFPGKVTEIFHANSVNEKKI